MLPDGRNVYFRARGLRWSVTIGQGSDTIGGFVSDDDAVWIGHGLYGVEPGDAGWMPEEIARDIIRQCVDQYLLLMSVGARAEAAEAERDRLAARVAELEAAASDAEGVADV